MKFISLQHISIEDPGTFKDFLIEDGHSITTIQLDEGDSIPNNLDEGYIYGGSISMVSS